MFNCIKGKWEIKLKKDLPLRYFTIKKDTTLQVKDKFPDNNGDTERGVWEIKDGHGGLLSMSLKDREEYFYE